MHHLVLETRRLLSEIEGNSRNICIQMSQARYLLAELRRNREKISSYHYAAILVWKIEEAGPINKNLIDSDIAY